MRTKALLFVTALTVVWLSSAVTPATAANINTHGAACQVQGPPGNVLPVPGGLANFGPNAASIICTIPRSPLPAGATTGSFYVDFLNTTNSTVRCTLASINFNGNFGGSVSFSSSASTIDQLVTLPIAQLGSFFYTSLTCTLPSGVVLIGVTSLQ